MEYNSKKQKKLALLQMKRYNIFQNKQVELLTTEHNLDDLLMKIQGAETNVQLIDSYKSAKFALDGVLDGLDVDQVDDIVLSLQDSIDKQQQIDSSMDLQNMDEIEMNDLEEELSQLAKELEEEKKIKENTENTTDTQIQPNKEEDLDETLEKMLANLDICKDDPEKEKRKEEEMLLSS